MNAQDLKKKLHFTLISNSKINDICEDLQDKYSEQANQYNQTLSLLNELLEVNTKLRVIIESKRKAHNKLKETYTELKENSIPISPEERKQWRKAIEDTKRLILEHGETIDDLDDLE